VDAGEDLDECGLARAVLSHEAVDLTGEELDVTVLESANGAEALLGVFGATGLGRAAVSSRSGVGSGRRARARRPHLPS